MGLRRNKNKKKDKKKKKEGFIASPGFLEKYKIVGDFEPVSPELIRKIVLSDPAHNYQDIVGIMLSLTRRFATEHCKIRFECSHKGDIGACVSCFCEQILVPDMETMAGGKVVVWAATRGEE